MSTNYHRLHGLKLCSLSFWRQKPEISLIGLNQGSLGATSIEGRKGRLLPAFSSCGGSLHSSSCGPFLSLQSTTSPPSSVNISLSQNPDLRPRPQRPVLITSPAPPDKPGWADFSKSSIELLLKPSFSINCIPRFLIMHQQPLGSSV